MGDIGEIHEVRTTHVTVIGQVKGIMCDADDLSHLLTSYRQQLKSSAAFSSLPDVVHHQLAQFMVLSRHRHARLVRFVSTQLL